MPVTLNFIGPSGSKHVGTFPDGVAAARWVRSAFRDVVPAVSVRVTSVVGPASEELAYDRETERLAGMETYALAVTSNGGPEVTFTGQYPADVAEYERNLFASVPGVFDVTENYPGAYLAVGSPQGGTWVWRAETAVATPEVETLAEDADLRTALDYMARKYGPERSWADGIPGAATPEDS